MYKKLCKIIILKKILIIAKSEEMLCTTTQTFLGVIFI